MTETPQVVRAALLSAPIRVAGLAIGPFSLQAQLILEEIGHPAVSEANPKLSSLQNAALIYVLAGDPEEVVEAAMHGQDSWT